MSSEEKPELPYVSNYDWDAIVDWAREKEKEGAELAQQREDEEKERTKSAAAKNLLEQQIVDEIEIKQEIVLDPNE